MEKRKKYIAYGSNLNLEQMARRCPTAKVIGAGEIRDHELLFRGYPKSAVATVEPKKGAGVPVLIWEIGPEDERNLDIYEGYPRLYGKVTITTGYLEAGFDVNRLLESVSHCKELAEREPLCEGMEVNPWNQQLLQ